MCGVLLLSDFRIGHAAVVHGLQPFLERHLDLLHILERDGGVAEQSVAHLAVYYLVHKVVDGLGGIIRKAA